MKNKISKLITLAAIVAVVVMAGSVAAWAQATCPSSPSYSPNFSSNQSCIVTNGSASLPTGQNILQLTSATYTETGSAWYITPQAVESGFSTSFTFQLTDASNPPADGFAFLIQNSASGTGALVAEPVGGCSLGFAGDPTYGVCGPKSDGGITNSVAIAFKTYNNGSNYPNANSVSIQNPGGTGVNCMDRQAAGVYACTIAENDLNDFVKPITLADGNVHSVTITFMPSTLTNCGQSQKQTCSLLDVFLDGNDLFNGGVHFDMATIGLSPDNTALVGFTGATGASYENHNILSWVFTPQGQSQSGTVTQGETTTFNFNGGFTEGGSNSGFDFAALETDTNQNLQMVVTTIPMSQSACNALVQASYPGAQCFVYQNGGGQGSDMAVMFAVTCPSAGTCGSSDTPFDANLSSDFNFVCTGTENSPLVCPTFDMNGNETNPGSFGYPNITSSDSLPEIGFLKGEGPDPSNPCTPFLNNSQPLFQSNQIISSTIGDSSQKPIKSGSGGTGSCWVPTYLTGASEIPTIVITSPAQNSSFVQGSNQLVNYTCTSVNNGTAATGPYLTVASCNGDTSQSSESTVMDSANLPTTTLGENTYTAFVQDSAYNTSTATLTYFVDAAPAFTSANATTFTVGTAGSFTVAASGYPTPTFTETGALPTGVTFSNGVLSGTPAAGTGGIYNITFTASNGVAPNAMQNFTLTVDQAPVITSANSAVFTVGVGGSFAVTASAFPASVTFTETGALPMGVSLSSSGLLSGIPVQGSEAAYPIVITATNGAGNGMQSFTLNVAQASTMTTVTSSLNPSSYGQSVTFTATVAPQVSGTPTGTVSFYNATSGANCAALGSSTLLGTGTLSSGTTSIDTGSLPAGSDTILACYSGDANFYSTALNGTSTTIIETVGVAPVVSLSPSGLTFGNQQVKTSSAPIVVTLTNIGDANLTGLNVQITGTNPGDFKETTSCSSSLGYTAPNNYCTISVTFTPTDTGIRTASLQFTDNANDSPEFVSLTGAGVSTLSANFNGNPIAGGSYIWFTSVGTLKGLGSNTVNLYITDSTISFTANGTNYSIPVPNAVITFQPNGKSTYTSFDSTNNRWVTVEPNLGLFGNTFLDGLSWQVPAGGLPGNIKNVTWTAAYSTDTPGISLTWFWGGAVYSSQFTNSYSGLTSCNTSATPLCVKPTDDSRASQYQNWDLAGTPENVTPYYKQRFMWGTMGSFGWGWTGGFSGTAGVVPTVAPASVSPSQLTFATQSVGTSSGSMTAVLTNNGSVSLTGISIPAVSDDFSQTNNCGSSLAAGASCTITVTFTPTDIGTRTGQFNISNSAKNSPQILYLTGTGQ